MSADGCAPQQSEGQRVSDAAASACRVASRLLDAGRAGDAMRVLEHEAEAGRYDAEYQFLLGRAAFHADDHSRARRALCRAIALCPGDAESYRWLARLLARRGDVRGAEHALRRTPSRPQARTRRG